MLSRLLGCTREPTVIGHEVGKIKTKLICFFPFVFTTFTSLRAVKLGCISTKKEMDFFVLSSICTNFVAKRKSLQ